MLFSIVRIMITIVLYHDDYCNYHDDYFTYRDKYCIVSRWLLHVSWWLFHCIMMTTQHWQMFRSEELHAKILQLMENFILCDQRNQRNGMCFSVWWFFCAGCNCFRREIVLPYKRCWVYPAQHQGIRSSHQWCIIVCIHVCVCVCLCILYRRAPLC